MRPEGFELTIHQSAIKPQLVAGIPRQLALALYTLMAALTFGGRHVIPTPQSVVATMFHDPGYSVWANLKITAGEADRIPSTP